jgi:tetratricopeptide (TPR) repeat protein
LARVLFLAHRCRASGHLRVFDGEANHSFHLREGGVVDVEGIDQPLGALAPDAHCELGLERAIGEAMASGHSLEAVLEEVCRNVGKAMAAWCLTDIGILSFKPLPDASTAGFRLPWSIVAMLSHGLHLAGSTERGEKLLEAQPLDPIAVMFPSDAERRLDLDALSMRVLNLARANPPFQDLVARATRGNSARRREVLHRVFLLHETGLLHLPERPLETDEETQRVVRRRPARRRQTSQPPEMARRSRSPERTPGGDRRTTKRPEAEQLGSKLRKRADILREQNFFQRLDLGDAQERPTPEQVDEAFHKLSKRYHPDRHREATNEVRDAAEDIFSLLSEAIEGLRKKRVADEQWERNRCAQQGIPYVTDRDRTKAKMSYKKGERLFRNRDYTIAEACFHEAAVKDPLTPLYTFMHAYAAFLAKQMTGEETLKILTNQKAETQQQTSEFCTIIGRVTQLSGGDKEKATYWYQKAVLADPNNRDAQRELRLRAMRSESKPSPTSTFGSFLDRFRRKGDKGDD